MRLALRTQQILAYESGVTETPDPLGGSWFVETLTDQLEAAAQALPRRDRRARRHHARRSRPASSSARSRSRPTASQRAIEDGDTVVVGREPLSDDDDAARPADPADRSGGRSAARSPALQRVRAERDPASAGGVRWRSWTDAAAATANLMPPDDRGREGVRHARRDRERAAARVGRPSRADHGLMDDAHAAAREPTAAINRPARPDPPRRDRRARLEAALAIYRDRSACRSRRSWTSRQTGSGSPSSRSATPRWSCSRRRTTRPASPASSQQGRGLPPRLLRGDDLAAELTRLGIDGFELIDARRAVAPRVRSHSSTRAAPTACSSS